MNIFAVITIDTYSKGDVELISDIVAIFKEEDKAKALVEKIKKIKNKDKALEKLGITSDFDDVNYVSLELK